jgi:hypothetical protein
LWGKETETSLETVLSGTSEKGTKQEDAEEFLRAELAEKEQLVDDLKKAAKKIGVSWRTVWEAKRTLRIRARKDGFQGPWLWRLPDTPPKDAKNAA